MLGSVVSSRTRSFKSSTILGLIFIVLSCAVGEGEKGHFLINHGNDHKINPIAFQRLSFGPPPDNISIYTSAKNEGMILKIGGVALSCAVGEGEQQQ